MTTLAERLIKSREAKGWKKADLQRAAGLRSASTLTELEAGTIQQSPQLPAIAAALNVDPLWLQTGKAQSSMANTSPGPEFHRFLPLISSVKAGAWAEAVDNFEPGEAEDWIPTSKRCSINSYCLRVEGDSMTAPTGRSYPDGCIIFVDPEQRSPVSGDRVIAKINGDPKVTFKVFIQESGKTWLKPLNPQYPPIFDEFKILGKVLGALID